MVLTTSNEEKDRSAAYDAFVAGYLVKPVTYEEAATRLANHWSAMELP